VVVRTIGRPELTEALASVAAQTHRPIELVLVDARGGGGLSIRDPGQFSSIRHISCGRPLRRAVAANAGLAAARGDFVLFLDDDDWLLPEHISGLVSALAADSSVRAAYAGIECRLQASSDEWVSVQTFNEPFNRIRLLVQNFLPIHAVLFDRALSDEGVAFDESLDVFEDWDFWLQIASISPMAHVDQVSGVYRISPTSGFGVRPDDPARAEGYARILAKWLPHWRIEDAVAIAEAAAVITAPNAGAFSDAAPESTSSLSGEGHRLSATSGAEQRRAEDVASELALAREQLAAEQALKQKLLRLLDNLQSSTAWRFATPLRAAEARWPHLVKRTAAPFKAVVWGLQRRLWRRLRISRLAKQALAEGLFERSWYVERNPDVVLAGLDPVIQWFQHGWQEGRDPSPHFCSRWYLEQLSATPYAGANPLAHYLERGRAAGFHPCPGGLSDDGPRLPDRGDETKTRRWCWPITPRRRRAAGLSYQAALSASNTDADTEQPAPKTAGFAMLRDKGRRRIWQTGRRRFQGLEPSPELLDEWVSSDWPDYHRWLRSHEHLDQEQWRRLRAQALALHRRPRFAIVTPVFDPQPSHLLEMVLSIRLQSYPFWRLYLIDDASSRPESVEALRQAARSDARVAAIWNGERLGISAATNRGLARAREDYVVFVDHDDRLSPDALSQLATAILADPGLDLVYTDRDVLAPNGERIMHQLKPAWSPELLLSGNYLFHLTCYRSDFLRALGGYRSRFDGSQDYDLALRAAERAPRVLHLPRVAYQWRQHSRSISLDQGSKSFVYNAGVEALQAALDRRGVDFRAEEIDDLWPGNYRIVPRRQVDFHLIRVPSPLDAADYARHLKAGLCAAGDSDYVVVLSEDLLDALPDQAAYLAAFLSLPDVAMATGKVVTDTHEIVHGGVVLQHDGVPNIPYDRYPESTAGYMATLRVLRNVSVPWPWCFAVRSRAAFAAGGVDGALRGPFAAFDLAMRLRYHLGQRVVFVPDARFVLDAPVAPLGGTLDRPAVPPALAAVREDIEIFRARWGARLAAGDPYLNPGLAEDAIDMSLGDSASSGALST
jgi:glycosyltransferase involved in cell wall biosynthesis